MKYLEDIKLNRIVSNFFNDLNTETGLHRDVDYYHNKTNVLIFYLSWSNDEVVIYCDDIERIIGIDYNMVIHNGITSLFIDYDYKYRLIYEHEYYTVDSFFNR